MNYETRCVESHCDGICDGICDDTNMQKSDKTFQFDVARRRSMVD